MGDEILIEVGQNPKTEKWHSRVDFCDGSPKIISPPCETEQEAVEFRELALEMAKRSFARYGCPIRVEREN